MDLGEVHSFCPWHLPIYPIHLPKSTCATTRLGTCRMLTFAINNTAFRELVDEFPEALRRCREWWNGAVSKNGIYRKKKHLFGGNMTINPRVLGGFGAKSQIHYFQTSPNDGLCPCCLGKSSETPMN